MPKSLPIENASSMHRHTSVLVQSIMHTAIENMSSAYTCAILNVIRTSLIFCADTHAKLNTCRVV